MLDEIICINKYKMPDRRDRFLTCEIFINNLSIVVVRGYFSVYVYKYASPGSLSKYIVVFKVNSGASYERQSIIEAISAASQQAPIFLSRRETSDYVASV